MGLLSFVSDFFTVTSGGDLSGGLSGGAGMGGIDTSSGGSADWHNNWGTAADYQVPAETFNTVSSFDPGSSGFGGGFGGEGF